MQKTDRQDKHIEMKVNPIITDTFACLFDWTTVGRSSD